MCVCVCVCLLYCVCVCVCRLGKNTPPIHCIQRPKYHLTYLVIMIILLNTRVQRFHETRQGVGATDIPPTANKFINRPLRVNAHGFEAGAYQRGTRECPLVSLCPVMGGGASKDEHKRGDNQVEY